MESKFQISLASIFEQLQAGDILFIDSTHVVRIDGDVPYLLLEVLPRLQKGVVVHIHDIPFPYNVPQPANTWILGCEWPVFWTETMLLQALLCNSAAFRIKLSLPMIRYFEESYLAEHIPAYEIVDRDSYNTYSSIWIEKSDRKSTRLNSSHVAISYAVFCLKKKSKMYVKPHKVRTV